MQNQMMYAFCCNCADGAKEDEEESKITQSDYNRALGNAAVDLVYSKFLRRVRRGGAEQVLRYDRWGSLGPLLLSSASYNGDYAAFSPQPCELCGAPRKLEFQVCFFAISLSFNSHHHQSS